MWALMTSSKYANVYNHFYQTVYWVSKNLDIYQKIESLAQMASKEKNLDDKLTVSILLLKNHNICQKPSEQYAYQVLEVETGN